MKNLIRKILKENFDPENFDWIQQDVKQFNPAEEFLYDLTANLKVEESKESPGWMLYKDKTGKNLMADNIKKNPKNPILYVDYNQIWVKLNKDYGLSYDEVMALCIRMLEMVHERKISTEIAFFPVFYVLPEDKS